MKVPIDVDLVTIGRVNLDLYAQQTGVEFADVDGFDAMLGGSPINIAIAAARLGVHAGVFTAVGADLVGDWVLRALEREGVSTAFVARKPSVHTSLALLAQIPPDRFPRTFYRDNPADIHLTVEEATRLPFDGVRAVLVSGDAFARGSTAEASEWILRECRRRDATVYVDLDLRPEHWLSLEAYARVVRPALAHADVVIGTTEEFIALLHAEQGDGQDLSPEGLRAQLSTLGAVLVVKRGASGATIVFDNDTLSVPAPHVQVASTVGAGDSFAAGLIAARLDGLGWAGAGDFAAACGAITVTRPGCSHGFPHSTEVAAFLEQHRSHGVVADAH